MMFRRFENEKEEQLAAEIVVKIDKGEGWIFYGAEGSSDFGGFIDRLFYSDGDTYGTYSASIYDGKLHVQIGFNTDMPEDLSEELLSLIKKARNQVNTYTSIWYPPDNKRLDEFIFTQLPWKARGHKTYELTFKKVYSYGDLEFPGNVCVIPFEDEHLETVCSMFDKSLSHTFADPNASVFLGNKENYLAHWREKAKSNDCCVMLENDELVGAYILNNSEIDLIAIAKEHQNRGLGRLLLNHARKHIFAARQGEPYLYCIATNTGAVRFYLKEGMKVTGYSGYACFEACDN